MSTNFNPTPFTAKDGSQFAAVIAGVDNLGNPDVLKTDGSGNLNISATVSGADGAILDGSSSSIKATVLDYTNSNPLAVRLTDTNGDYIAAGAGTQYTEDVAAASDPIGNMLLARRKDTLSTSEVSADGDNIALNATNKGQLHVKLADTVSVDGSGVTQPISAASLPLPTGAATSTKQSDGSQKTQIVDGSGNVIGATSNALDVNIKSGSSAGTEYTEDAAAAANPSGPMTMAVRADSLSGLTTTDGDNVAVRATDKGEMYVKHADSIAVTSATFATAAKQDTGNTSLASIDGKITAVNTGAVVVSSSALPSGAATSAKQDTQITAEQAIQTSVELIDDGVYTDDTSTHATGTSKGYGIMAVATPTDAAVDANDIGMVAMTTSRLLKVDASGAAVPVTDNGGNLSIDDGGNSITVDGTVSITSNSSVNVAQLAGTTTDTNSGSKSAGTLRVVLATDQPQLTNKLLVTPDANSAVNVAQVGGSNVVTATTGVQKVGIVGNAAATIDSTVAAGSAPTNQIVTGQVYNSTAPAPTNGQAMAMQSDQAGNHLVAPGIATASLSAWSSATSINTTQNIFTKSGVPAALVHIVQSSGSFSAGAITFEVTYDNSNWITISADCVLDPTSTSLAQISLPYTLVTSTNKGFLLLTKGAQGLRIKLSTAITGTGTVTPNYALLPSNPVQQVLAYNPTATNLKAQAEVYQGGSAVASGNPLQVTLANTGANTNKILVTPDANSAVNVAQMNGVTVTMNNGAAGTGVQRVTIANDSTGNIATIGTSVTPGTAAANLGKAEDAAHTTGDTGVMMLGVRETTLTDLSAGNTDGDYEPFQVNKSGAVWVTGAPSGTSGWSVATGSIGATKTDIGTANTAGNVGGWYIYNPNSSVAYVQFFNAQASAVTLGTTAPVYSLGIPATSAANIAPGMVGITHSTAICIAITTTRAGSTGPSSTVDYNLFYKQ